MIPYTDKAKKALNYANRLSRSSGCNYVGTEHILAGLLKEGTGVAAEVLTANNVELEALLKLIDELVAAGEEVTVADRDGYSPRTQMVLDRAREMADRFDSERIGTEHLLLAIIKRGLCSFPAFKYNGSQPTETFCGYSCSDGRGSGTVPGRNPAWKK